MSNLKNLKEIRLNENNSEKVILPCQFETLEECTVEKLEYVKSKPFYSFFKRSFDIFASAMALILLSPLFLVISIIIKCTSKGSVFYVQERLGYMGKKFKLIKFRTMNVDAEKDGAKWSTGDTDERIYPFGRFLRKTRLDEIPQFYCCLIGTMSLIGPRPERECYYIAFEKKVHGFKQRLYVRPGISGLAQVSGGYNLTPVEKVNYDIEYIKKRSIWLDVKIFFKTVMVVFTHDGAK